MNISTHSINMIEDNSDCFLIKINKSLTSSTSGNIRSIIQECIIQSYPVVYIDSEKVEEIDLSGINEVIHTHFTLEQNSQRLVFAYRKNSLVENWVKTTGLDRFIGTAIIA